MGSAELAGRRAPFSPGLDELPIFREFRDPSGCVRRSVCVLAAVSFTDEDIAVWSRDDVARFIESVVRISGDSRLTERQQYLAFGIKIDERVALSFCISIFIK